MKYLLIIFFTFSSVANAQIIGVVGNGQFKSKTSGNVTPPPTDTTPPTAPSSLVVSNIGETTATLTWTASTDANGISYYRIYNNNVSIVTSTGSNATTYNLTGLTPNTSYTITVRGVDPFSNISSNSNSQTFTTDITDPNSFTLAESFTTSAGVYDVNDNLLRTLQSNVVKEAGTYNISDYPWDGNDDFGNNVSAQGDHIKVIANNISSTWKGAKIGNTSDGLSGQFRHHGLKGLHNWRRVQDRIYYTNDNNEQRQCLGYVDVSNPQVAIGLLGKMPNSIHCTNDGGNIIYFSIEDYHVNPRKSWVFGVNYSDNLQTNFSSGTSQPATYAMTFSSAIDIVNDNLGEISGLAVSNTHLYVAREQINSIHVLNKTTGAFVSNISTLTAPTKMEFDGTNLWIISSAGLQKYSLNSDGSLNTALITINTLDLPYALAVNPSKTIISVCDGGSYQQIRHFNISNGIENTPFGVLGGYSNSPLVTNDKFFFSNPWGDGDYTHKRRGALTYNPDGSYWVSDIMNERVQLYNSSNVWQDRVMFMPGIYSSGVDLTNPNRVFYQWHEFEMDWSKPAEEAWTLKYNWRYNINTPYNTDYNALTSVRTFSNGRTYTLLVKTGVWIVEIAELDPNTGVRNTFVSIPNIVCRFTSDGRIVRDPETALGGTANYTYYNITGFNGSNNPILSSAQTFTSVTVTATNPYSRSERTGSEFIDGNLIVFDPKRSDGSRGLGYHLGMLKPNGAWKWRTNMNRFGHPTNASDKYDKGGGFDSGSSIINAGSKVMVVGDFIVTGVYNEFYKNFGQSNTYFLWHKTGLLLKDYGTDWTYTPYISYPYYQGPLKYWEIYIPFPEMAGNALNPALTIDPIDNTKMHMIHGDEGWHGGLHWWEIANLDSVQEFNLPLNP